MFFIAKSSKLFILSNDFDDSPSYEGKLIRKFSNDLAELSDEINVFK